MKKTKTNISVVNNAGVRRNASVHVGKLGPFPSGDILDANAIQEMIDDDSLAVSAALNDLNSRVGSGGGIGEDEELIISTALNDLNSRVSAVENSSGGASDIDDFIICQYHDDVRYIEAPGEFGNGIDYGAPSRTIINCACVERSMLDALTFKLASGEEAAWAIGNASLINYDFESFVKMSEFPLYGNGESNISAGDSVIVSCLKEGSPIIYSFLLFVMPMNS